MGLKETVDNFKTFLTTVDAKSAELEQEYMTAYERDQFQAREALDRVKSLAARDRELFKTVQAMPEGENKVAKLQMIQNRLARLKEVKAKATRTLSPDNYTDISNKALEDLGSSIQEMQQRAEDGTGPLLDPNYTKRVLDTVKALQGNISEVVKNTKLEAEMKARGLKPKPAAVEKDTMSAVEALVTYLNIPLWTSANLLNATVDLAKGKSTDALAKAQLAWKIAAPKSLGGRKISEFTKAVHESVKSLFINLGVSKEPFKELLPKQYKDIKNRQAEIINKLGSIKQELEARQGIQTVDVPITSGSGETTTVSLTTDQRTHALRNNAEQLEDEFRSLRVKENLLNITPAGMAGFFGSFIIDMPAWAGASKLIGGAASVSSKTAQAVSRGSLQAVKATKEAIKARVPEAVKATETFQNLMNMADRLPDSALAKVAAGEAPLTSVPLVRSVLRGFQKTAALGKNAEEQKVINDAFKAFAPEAREMHKAMVNEAIEIFRPMPEVLSDVVAQEKATLALMKLQDLTHAVVRKNAISVEQGRQWYKDLASRIAMKKETTEAERLIYREINARIKVPQALDELGAIDNAAYDAGVLLHKDKRLRNKVAHSFSKIELDEEMVREDLYHIGRSLISGTDNQVLIQIALKELPANQREALPKLLDWYKKLGQAKLEQGILKDLLPNYSPRALTQLREVVQPLKVADVLATTSKSSRHRVFATFTEAQQWYRKAGYELIYDVAKVAEAEALKSSRQLAAKNLVSKLEKGLDLKQEAWDPHLKQIVQDLAAVKTPTGADKVLKVWRSWFLDNYKAMLLFGRPDYHVRNIIDDAIRSSLSAGSRVFNPFAMRNHLNIFAAQKNHVIPLSKSVTMSAAEINELFWRKGIYKPEYIAGDIAAAREGLIASALKHPARDKAGRILNIALMGPEMGKNIHNFQRGVLGLTLLKKELKAGKNFEEAITAVRSQVDDALISYDLDGPALEFLSNFMPFIRFQSHSLKFYLETAMKRPHLMNRLGIIYNHAMNNTLTDEEKKNLSPFLKEMLAIDLGEDLVGNKLFLYNTGISLEVINQLLAVDPGGTVPIDVGRTFEKLVGQVPAVQWLIGYISEKNLFFNDSMYSVRARKTYKYYYENDTLNQLMGGVVRKNAGNHPVTGDPLYKYELLDPKQAFMFTNIVWPLVASVGVMKPLKMLVGESPSVLVGALLGPQSPLIGRRRAQMSDEDKTKLVRTVNALTGLKIMSQNISLQKFYNAIETIQRAGEELEQYHKTFIGIGGQELEMNLKSLEILNNQGLGFPNQ